jgi:hypothetical protein
MLYSKSGGTQDPYKTAVIDTMVAEIQNVPGDDRCVLLLGYKEQMEDMFKVSACDAHDQKSTLMYITLAC